MVVEVEFEVEVEEERRKHEYERAVQNFWGGGVAVCSTDLLFRCSLVGGGSVGLLYMDCVDQKIIE